MNVTEALLESWDRQCRILTNVATLINESNRHAKPSTDGWSLDFQLAHVHQVRRYWLSQVAPERAKAVAESFIDGWQTPISDLEQIKTLLDDSAVAVREAMVELIAKDVQSVGGYDHPVLFLQHMIWHEGWHVGLIFLALRLNGQEPPEVWEEPHVWGQWRVEEW